LLTAAFHSGAFEGARQLMITGEILSIESRKRLLFVQEIRAIRARKIRFFDSWELRFKLRAKR